MKNFIISGEIQVHDFMNNNHCDDTYYFKPWISVNVINDNTTESGGTALFTVKLDSEPTANVTIPISSDNVSEGNVSVSSLTFTSVNWSAEQTVTVTGVDDSVVDDNVTYNIVVGPTTSIDSNYDGLDDVDISIINI